VLLLLYLALDDSDDRPLDHRPARREPRSDFDELVALFIAAKSKHQVIVVTHNANLVVNTDADQIIVAEAGEYPSGGLPPISYVAGGLESAAIRKAVCDVLEGGEAAFRERARRLRVLPIGPATLGPRAGTQSAHTCGGKGDLVWALHLATDS
jgi:hypothetical protein